MANKGGKDVGVATALRAFEATYKAACKRHDTLPQKPLLNALQQAQENSSKYEKVLLTGHSIDGAAVRAIVECLASYAPVCSLCCYGCSIGDEGLVAIACLLRSSASRWWKGCKLSTIELCADGRTLPLQTATATNRSAAPGSTLSSLAGQSVAVQAPRSLTGSAAANSVGQLQSSSAGLRPGATSKAGNTSRPRTAAAGSVGRSSSKMQGTHAVDAPNAWHVKVLQRPSSANPACRADRCQSPVGVCPLVPAHLQLNFPTHMQLAQQSLAERVGPLDRIHYRSPPPRPAVDVGRWVLDATMQGWRRQQQEQLWQFHSPRLYASGSGAREQGVAASGQPLWCQQLPAEQHQDEQLDISEPQLQQEQQQQWLAACDVQAENHPWFGAAALQELSLSLGVAGLKLTRLVLDHTLIGDLGVSILATGLSKCQSLKHISLCDCHIGPLGIKDLAAACVPRNAAAAPGNISWSSNGSTAASSRLNDGKISNAVAAADQRSSSSVSGILCLEALLLNGNPLTAVGLQHLTPMLRCMQNLKVLGLADIGVTDHDKVQLQGLVHAVSTGPKQLEQLDFDANYIGDRAAAHLVTLLSSNPSLLLLKVTARISPEVMLQLTTLTEQNIKAAKAAKTKKPPKAK